MAPLHRVYFLGTLLRDPEVWHAPNGTAVARWSLAVPPRLRREDPWHDDVCCIEVVAFGPQAETAGAALRTGHTVLIEGRVPRRRGALEGPARGTPEVRAERIRLLAGPRAGALGTAGVGRSSGGARPPGEALATAEALA